MARFYANENLPLQVVEALRLLGNDVLTTGDAGNANRSLPDNEVLQFASAKDRILVTHNRRHFLRLHQSRREPHAGILVCTFDPDFQRQAQRIDEAVRALDSVVDELVRVNRPIGPTMRR